MNSSTSTTVNFASLVGQLDLSLKNIDFNFFMIMIIFPIGLVLNSIQLYVFSKKELNLKTNMGSMHALLSLSNTQFRTELFFLETKSHFELKKTVRYEIFKIVNY
jgi:hypothetical protein